MPIAYAHSAVPGAPDHAPAGLDMLLAWTVDPTFLVPLVLGWLYLRGLRRYRRHGGVRFPGWRPLSFWIGVGTIALALLSPIDALADYSFTWHMVQHMLLTLVGVPFLLLGAPFLPVVRGLPAWFRRRWFGPFARNPVVRWVAIQSTRPVPALVLYMANLWAWHHPTLYDAALFYTSVHYLEHFTFVITGLLLWWNVISPYPFRSRMHPLMQMAYLFLATLQNSALGAMISLSEEVLYAYRGLDEFWGLSMADDQLIGGALMWVGGGMMHLFAILAVFMVYAAQEQAKEPPSPLYITRGNAPSTAA